MSTWLVTDLVTGVDSSPLGHIGWGVADAVPEVDLVLRQEEGIVGSPFPVNGARRDSLHAHYNNSIKRK